MLTASLSYYQIIMEWSRTTPIRGQFPFTIVGDGSIISLSTYWEGETDKAHQYRYRWQNDCNDSRTNAYMSQSTCSHLDINSSIKKSLVWTLCFDGPDMMRHAPSHVWKARLLLVVLRWGTNKWQRMAKSTCGAKTWRKWCTRTSVFCIRVIDSSFSMIVDLMRTVSSTHAFSIVLARIR